MTARPDDSALKAAVERLTAIQSWSDFDDSHVADLRLVLARLAALERERDRFREALDGIVSIPSLSMRGSAIGEAQAMARSALRAASDAVTEAPMLKKYIDDETGEPKP